MRRVIMAAVSTVAALVLLLSFKTHSATSLATPPAAIASTVPSAGASVAATPSASAPTASASTPARAAPTTTTTKKATAVTKTVTGDAMDTRYGAVQVQITVTNGKLTAAQAVDYPQQERRDQEINAYAIPVLNQEALRAGSATIDNVSGATYTSDGYARSLQSALDKAGL